LSKDYKAAAHLIVGVDRVRCGLRGGDDDPCGSPAPRRATQQFRKHVDDASVGPSAEEDRFDGPLRRNPLSPSRRQQDTAKPRFSARVMNLQHRIWPSLHIDTQDPRTLLRTLHITPSAGKRLVPVTQCLGVRTLITSASKARRSRHSPYPGADYDSLSLIPRQRRYPTRSASGEPSVPL